MKTYIQNVKAIVNDTVSYVAPKSTRDIRVVLFCFISAIAEGANSIPGTGDGVFWLRNIVTGKNEDYPNAEAFFADYPALKIIRFAVSAIVAMTHYSFIRGAYSKEKEAVTLCKPVAGTAERMPSWLQYKSVLMLYTLSIWCVAVVSNFAEGVTSIPGLSSILQSITCDDQLNQCDQSSEIYISGNGMLMLTIFMIAGITAYVDFRVEGRALLHKYLAVSKTGALSESASLTGYDTFSENNDEHSDHVTPHGYDCV
jgi:hypothetical protein